MIGIIREHNLLTGYRFVVVEYGLVSLALGALAIAYALMGRWLDAAIWLGVAANGLVVLALALAAVGRHAHDFGAFPMRRASFRRSVHRHRPRLGRRTTVLILASFVPFLVVILAVGDVAADRRRLGALASAPRPAR